MNVNIKLRTEPFCYIYSKYKIEKYGDRKYILPDNNATKTTINIAENINKQLIDLLDIGKKAYFYEDIDDILIIDFASKYGLLGFMADFPINPYYIVDDDVIFRDYNFHESRQSISHLKIEEYLKLFMPTLNKRTINKVINQARKQLLNSKTNIISNINENLIYSKDYAESVDVIIYYSRELYKTIYEINKNNKEIKYPAISCLNHLSSNIDSLLSNNLEINLFYLKQAIDLAFSLEIAQDVQLLKICKFCNKVFIANNPKTEYDTYNCKNKANVYKSRAKSNIIHTENGIQVKVPSQELSDKLIKEVHKKFK